jgi:predicted nucleotidyltransferase
MNEKQASEASRTLLALARRIAQVYAAQPHARAIILTGSAAEGESDYYSDLDIILYYDKLPADEELLAAFQRNEGQDYRLLGQADEEKIESYLVDGVECQCAHTTFAAWERDMAVVLEQLDVTTPLQKALSGMLEALPLYGESLVRQWQAKLVAYPETLVRAMIEHYLPVYPLWGLQERLAGRDATIWVYEMLVEIAQHLLGVLAGLNRRYYSTFQVKRMYRFVAQLDIAPPDFADRLEFLFHADVASAAEQARALTRETVALVDEHMPQVDTSRARARIDFQQQAWKL